MTTHIEMLFSLLQEQHASDEIMNCLYKAIIDQKTLRNERIYQLDAQSALADTNARLRQLNMEQDKLIHSLQTVAKEHDALKIMAAKLQARVLELEQQIYSEGPGRS